jgi:stage II sporulation protein D
MRLVPLLIVVALCPAAIAAQPEEGLPQGPAPPVRVKLSSLGAPAGVSLRATSPLRLTDEKGRVLEQDAGEVTVVAAGGVLKVGASKASRLRAEGPATTLLAGKVSRTYPGALILAPGKAGVEVWNECTLDDYVRGVLSGECPALFQPEAIKATAVAVRSYTYRKAYLRGAELCDTTHCQLYRGTGGLPPSIREAVEATRGLCAAYEGEVIDAVYSADCGGYTEANEEAWKGARPLPYLRPVEDAPEPGAEPFCALNRSHRWTLALPRPRLRTLFGKPAPTLRVEVLELTESGRARRVQLAPVSEEGCRPGSPISETPARLFSGHDWRRILGLSAVRSLRFTVRETAEGVALDGRGWGHGVGLCQFGANGMAKRGMPFDAILKHYYRGIAIEPLPDVETARARLASMAQAKRR